MKNPNVEKLLKTIEEREETMRSRMNIFGASDTMTRSAFGELIGLEEAFEIITGMTVVEYVLTDEFRGGNENGN